MGKRVFRVVLIKPSHYDADGYVIQWWHSTIPSNSLASVYALIADCATSQVLGPDTAIEVEAYDECNTVIDVPGAIKRIRKAGAGFVGLVGVQSNQFPRAHDLARDFRAAAIPVVMGGFRAQPRLGADPRPADQAARRRDEDQSHPSGRHALPQDPELRRESGESRLQQRLHRAREHQSRRAYRGEKEAEPDLGISRDAAGVEARQGHDYAGYILGFPNDTPDSIFRDIATIQRELPLDLGEFMILTPLPGSEDHKNLYQKKVPMDPDMNKYDLEHVTTSHAKMSDAVMADTYHQAWQRYYSDAHIETILRRAVATGFNAKKMRDMLIIFAGSVPIEGVHPLQTGFGRRKIRRQRRSGLPIESALTFYPHRAVEATATLLAWARLAWRYSGILKRVTQNADAKFYRDAALQDSKGDEHEMPSFVQANANQLSKAQRAAINVAAH
jgi:hypothetical protein